MNITTYRSKLMSNFYIRLFQHIFRLPKDIEQIIMGFIDNNTIYYTFFVIRQFMFYRYTSYYINEVDLFRKLPLYFSYPSTDSICKYIASRFSSNRFSLKKYSEGITKEDKELFSLTQVKEHTMNLSVDKELFSRTQVKEHTMNLSVDKELFSQTQVKEHTYNKSVSLSRYLDDENYETSSNISLRHKRNKRKNKKPQNLDILLEKKRDKKILSKKRQISRDWKTKQYCTRVNDISTILYWHNKYLIREKEIDVYLSRDWKPYKLSNGYTVLCWYFNSEDTYEDWWETTELDEGQTNEWPHILDCGYEELY
jgi:hypothetical protein